MRIVLLTTLFAALCVSATTRADDIRAKTADGREVILKDDGTWSFVTPPEGEKSAPVNVKDKDARLEYEGKHKTFALHLTPETWIQAGAPVNPVAEVSFRHKDGDIYAMVIAERISVPLETLKKAALTHMRTVDKDAKIVSEEPRKVNGVDVLCITANVTSQGVPLTFRNYYYTGQAGSIQVATWTGQNLFDELKPELEKFLNGLVILKK